MLLALACLAAAFLVGLLAVSESGLKLSGVEKLCASFVAGFAVFAPATFVIALAIGMERGALLGVAAALLVVLALRRRIDWSFPFSWAELAFLALALAASAVALQHDQLELSKDGFLVAANSHGDLMYHLRVINSFAYSSNFPPQEPIYAGEPLKYHFLFDFFSATLLTLGFGLAQAVLVPAVFMMACLFALIFCFGSRFCGSRAAGLFAAFLFAFSGGWAYLLAYSPGIGFGELAKSVHDMYIENKSQFVFGNILETALEAQRPFLAGFALFMAVMLMMLMALGAFGRREAGKSSASAILLCGVLAGLSPLIHGYVFVGLLVSATAACLVFSGRKLRDLALFLAPAFVLAAPAAIFLLQGHGSGYPKLNIFWEADNLPDSLVFYVKNLGLYLPLLLGGLALADRKRRLFYLGPCALFLLANVAQLQWFEFDNYKLIAIWYLVGAFFAAGLLAELARRGGWLGVAVAAALLLVAGVDGILTFDYDWTNRYAVFGADEMGMAQWVIENTPAGAVFLTGQGHVHPLATLTGRRTVLGPYAWVVPHSLDYGTRSDEIHEVYSGGAEAAAVIGKYGVGYVVVGPYESELRPNESFFAGPLFRKVYDENVGRDRWRIYEVKMPGSPT